MHTTDSSAPIRGGTEAPDNEAAAEAFNVAFELFFQLLYLLF